MRDSIYSFKNDYSEGAHPNILRALAETNLHQHVGYGEDDFSKRAIALLKEKMDNNNVDIHLVSGGTQANLIVISSILRSFESVIAADTGHINVHETGAIEATGHKVNIIEGKNGKLTPDLVEAVLQQHTDEHMVKPKLVYISNTTEVGTVYKRAELEALYDYCKSKDLLLYMDGARLGSALASHAGDLSLGELSRLVDAFYIGGTKNGALLGEAIILCNDKLKNSFRYSLKQRGALLAKGRLLGIQFLELFKADLFFQLADRANSLATRLSKGIEALGYGFLTESESNQIFPIFPNEVIEELYKSYAFYPWSKIDDHTTSVRLVTSWATSEEAVEAFLRDLKEKSEK